jgi:mRNA interferase RelE/StbE
MASLILTDEAQKELDEVPLPIRGRMNAICERLKNWPAVSGAKPLRGSLAGNYRIRTGDYRLIFKVQGVKVIVWKIGYRGDIYD